MNPDDAVTYPVFGRNLPRPGSVALMVASLPDLQALCRVLELGAEGYRSLYMSRLYVGTVGGRRLAAVGPLMGAPYAVVLLETLIAAGIEQAVFWGWCGAVSAVVKIGDLIVPSGAVVDEGTSRHYGADPACVAKPSPEITQKLKDAFTRQRIGFHEGPIWTTDAIFRETCGRVEHFQSQGVLAVEMESAALFNVAKYRRVKVGALLVVSDELSSHVWKRGFQAPRFNQGRREAQTVLRTLCQNL